MTNYPDTLAYMILGFSVTIITLSLYVGSLVLRFRNLQRDEETLDELAK
jgi:hypothetical protein